MNTYCLSCKKDTKNIDSKVIKTKNNTKGSGLFDSLGLNIPQNRMKNALWNAFNR